MTCERCDELEETIRQLKIELRGGTKRFPVEWRLTRAQEIVLEHLVTRGRITLTSTAMLLWSVPPDTCNDIIRRHICEIRKRVPDITVSSSWGVGYLITPEEQQRLGGLRA